MRQNSSCVTCGRRLGEKSNSGVCECCLLQAALRSGEQEIREEILRITSSEERAAYVQEVCSDDPGLRNRLLAWLPELDPNGSKPFQDLSPAPDIDVRPINGRYHLLQKIGEGGFGAVYLAEQIAPVQRRVAVKILKLGMDTRQVMARFELERQTLAMMDHPNIAKVFDAGAAESGRPYFVMELVRGVPITRYCDEKELSIRQRLELFVQVCQAVQHAHQKGIIHRDLKPSNILIGVHEGIAAPKIIDFGIAKVTQHGFTDRTVLTQEHQFLGTPAYISPEQALITSEDIDTRSDIYSLGALLYELLAGKPPFDNQELLTGGIDEMRRIIRDVEPKRPTTRLAQIRGTAPRRSKLSTSLSTDLDWIVMKCLEKDRARRYETANGLARDVQRFLNNEPIVARPPSRIYRMSKAVRRRPLVAGLAALLVLAVATGLVFATVMSVRISRAKSETDRANRQLSRTVLFLESEKIEERAAEGWLAQPLAWLSHRLRSDPNDRAAAARLISMLSQRSFALPVFAPLQHTGPVHSVEFSPHGEIMTACEDGAVRFWDSANGTLLRAITNSSPVAMAAYAGGGTRLLVGHHDLVLRVYDTATDKLVFEVQKMTRPDAFWWAEGGRWLFVEQAGNKLSRWDLQTGKQSDPTITLPDRLISVHLSERAGGLAVLCVDKSVHILNQATGEPLVPSRRFPDANTAVFHPDGRHLFISEGAAQRVLIWACTEGNEVTELSVLAPVRPEALRVTPDGRRMLVWSWGSSLGVSDLKTLRPIGNPISCGPHAGFVLSHSGRLAASFGSVGYSRLIDIERMQALLEPMQHDGWVYAASFSKDDTLLLTGSLDGTARLWDIRMRTPARLTLAGSAAGGIGAFDKAGKRIAFIVGRGAVQMCDAETLKPVSPVLRHPTAEVDHDIRAVSFSPDDTRILTVSSQGLLRIWDASSFEPRIDMIVGRNIEVAKFSPDGRYVVAGDRDGFASIWSTDSGQLLANASHNRNEVLDLDFHPAGGLFVTAAFDAARCWTLPEGKLAMPPLKHRGIVWSVDYSPDGERIVTASADKTAQIWDSHTGKPLFNPLRHTKELFLAAFSPDSRRILTTSEDGTARVWNAETGEPVSPFVRHDASVWRGAFSPDGRMVATASIGKMARIWDPETGLPMSEPITDDSVGRLMFSPDGRRLLTFGSEARLWDAIVPPTPVPLWFCELVEAVSGFRQASDGQLLGTTPDAIATARLRVVKGTQHDFYSRWAKWFLVDRMQESVSAFRAESKGPP